MALIDNQLRLSTAQAVSGVATVGTTDYWDTGKAREIGNGEPLAMVFTVTTAADYTTTDETYSFAVQGDDNTSFTTPVLMAQRTYSLANTNLPSTYLTAGKQVVVPIPPGFQERYLRGAVVMTGTTPSVSITTDIMPLSMVSKVSLQASGFAVS